MSEAFSEDQIAALQQRAQIQPVLRSSCDEYACPCHFDMPRVLAALAQVQAERDALRAERDALDMALDRLRGSAEGCEHCWEYV